MTWHLICHRSELAQPGDYLVLGAQNQFCAYNLDGTVIVWDNICKHRGSRVLEGHGNKSLVCPYHGMRGEAVIGNRYLTAWVGDWLMAGDGSIEMRKQFGGDGLELLEEISDGISKRVAYDSMPMPCSWKVAVENALEDYHVESVHADTFGKLGLVREAMERFDNNSIAIYTVGDERTVRGLTALYKHFDGVNPTEYFHLYLYPYTCLSSVGGFSYSLQHYMPNHSWTSFSSRLYAGKTNANAPDLSWFYAEAADFNRKVFAQDSAACARVVGDGTFLTDAEARVKWFRDVK